MLVQEVRMQLCVVGVEALLLQAIEVGPSYVRDIWHIGEDFELLDCGKAGRRRGVARCCICVCVNCSRAPEGGEDEGLLLLHPYDLPLLPGGTHGYAGRMPHQASTLSDPRELTPAGHVEHREHSVCV